MAKNSLEIKGENEKTKLKNLLLDENNPRFGDSKSKFSSQKEVLNWVVENFGVNDVINSLAINGYFEAEPLVVEKDSKSGKMIVKEGNRRLAACLILANDPRAADQKQLRAQTEKITTGTWNQDTEIPTIIFSSDNANRLIAYLGVRHIVSSQPWDSYAKAAWIANVVKNHDLTISEIADLTGDKSQTVAKLLEGYNLIRQLEYKGLFNPTSSYRRGKGSNVTFPFSWVYTILQYSNVRDWLQLGSYSTKPEPVPPIKEKDAAELLHYMFGNRTIEQQPAVKDSRDLGALAYSISTPVHRELLRSKKSLSEIENLTKPANERTSTLLLEMRDKIREVNGILSDSTFSEEDTVKFIELARNVRKSTTSAIKELESRIDDDEDEDD